MCPLSKLISGDLVITTVPGFSVTDGRRNNISTPLAPGLSPSLTRFKGVSQTPSPQIHGTHRGIGSEKGDGTLRSVYPVEIN